MMFFDTAVRYQINLQDSATYGMEMIIQLHNYVMFLNVFIISVVIWFFFEIIAVTGFLQWFFFRVTFHTRNKLRLGHLIFIQINKAMLHMSTLEIIWTLLPVLALISIALPSLSMLYYFSLSFSPAVVVNVIGHQWFWSYEYPGLSDYDSLAHMGSRAIERDGPFYRHSLNTVIKNSFPWGLDFFNSIMPNGDRQIYPYSYIYGDNYLKFFRSTPSVLWKPLPNLTQWIEFFEAMWPSWFLIEERPETFRPLDHTRHTFDSIMLQLEDLSNGSFRLLEVDKPLFLPVDTPIRVIVSSDDVLHSWAVPSLGVKIDCVPGRLNVVEFRIARSGIFYGQCSEICGTQHGFMPICIVSIPQKLFNLI